jgi:hypothetical protein
MTYVFYRVLRCFQWNSMRSPSCATGESWETRRTLAIHSPWITFALPAAPPASAYPSPDRPGSVRAAEMRCVSAVTTDGYSIHPGDTQGHLQGSSRVPRGTQSRPQANPPRAAKNPTLWVITCPKEGGGRSREHTRRSAISCSIPPHPGPLPREREERR